MSVLCGQQGRAGAQRCCPCVLGPVPAEQVRTPGPELPGIGALGWVWQDENCRSRGAATPLVRVHPQTVPPQGEECGCSVTDQVVTGMVGYYIVYTGWIRSARNLLYILEVSFPLYLE